KSTAASTWVRSVARPRASRRTASAKSTSWSIPNSAWKPSGRSKCTTSRRLSSSTTKATTSSARYRNPFARQQLALERDCVAAAAVTTDLVAGRGHAVARDDKRNRVVAHRAARGARGTGPAREGGEFTVRNRLTPRHFAHQRFEHGALETVDAVEV